MAIIGTRNWRLDLLPFLYHRAIEDAMSRAAASPSLHSARIDFAGHGLFASGLSRWSQGAVAWMWQPPTITTTTTFIFPLPLYHNSKTRDILPASYFPVGRFLILRSRQKRKSATVRESEESRQWTDDDILLPITHYIRLAVAPRYDDSDEALYWRQVYQKKRRNGKINVPSDSYKYCVCVCFGRRVCARSETDYEIQVEDSSPTPYTRSRIYIHLLLCRCFDNDRGRNCWRTLGYSLKREAISSAHPRTAVQLPLAAEKKKKCRGAEFCVACLVPSVLFCSDWSSGRHSCDAEWIMKHGAA